MIKLRVPKIITEKDGILILAVGMNYSERLVIYSKENNGGGIRLTSPSHVELHCNIVNRQEPRVNIVRQGKYECGPAALAMLLQEPLIAVKRAYAKLGWNNDENGINDVWTLKVAKMFGRDLVYTNRPTGKPCLVTLKSLNVLNAQHVVTWDGQQILDPNWGYKDRKWWSTEWAPWTLPSRSFLRLMSDSEQAEQDEFTNQLMGVKL